MLEQVLIEERMYITEIRIPIEGSEYSLIVRYDADIDTFYMTDEYDNADNDEATVITEEAAVQLVEAIRKLKGETK